MNRPWTKYWNLLIIGCVLLISACNAPQAPDFQGVENLKIDVQGHERRPHQWRCQVL